MTLDNDKARELFNAARNLPSAKREPFLDNECGDDDALRAEVEALLSHHITPTSFPTIEAVTQSPESYPPTEHRFQSGDRIGNFEIIKTLGEGGFGTVYLAKQHEPVERDVALKVLHANRCTEKFIRGFEEERQILAEMNHPGIAHFYDAGFTQFNQPYFVMEYVDGDPITEYCDNKNLTIAQRLKLFAEVCKAVQHAHNKLVIHRDLAPNNILVTDDDEGNPRAKIIDFGISKSGDDSTEDVAGTLQYMSPEQATRGKRADAKSDIFTLGVVLYELLVGSPPLDVEMFQRVAMHAQLKLVQEQEPPDASTKLSGLHDASLADAIASARQEKLESLIVKLRRELDWIPRKALQKDPDRRYTTASSFGEDILRYLGGDPIEAAPDSSMYRLKKSLRRHKAQFVAAAIVLIVLIAGITGTSTQWMRAIEEKDNALEKAYFLNIHAAHTAINAGDTSTASKRLGSASSLVRYRPDGDLPIEWNMLDARMDDSIVSFENSERVNCFRIAPDGETLMTAGKSLRTWDKNGSLLTEKIIQSRQYGVSISQDARYLVSRIFDTPLLSIWDIEEDKLVSILENKYNHGSYIFSSDNKKLITFGSWDIEAESGVHVWEVSSGDLLYELQHDLSLLGGAAFNDVHGWIFTWDSSGLFIAWSILDGEKLFLINHVLTGTSGEEYYESGRSLGAADISLDGNRLAAAFEGEQIVIWNLEDRKIIHKWNLGDTEINNYLTVNELRFSDDRKFLACSCSDRTIRLLNVENGEVTTLVGTEDFVGLIQFSGDGNTLASRSGFDIIKIWDLDTGLDHMVLQGIDLTAHSVSVSSTGSLIAASGFDGLIVFDTRTKEHMFTISDGDPYGGLAIGETAFCPTQEVLAYVREGNLQIFDMATGNVLIEEDLNMQVYDLAFHPEGTLLALNCGDKVLIFDIEQHRVVTTLAEHNGSFIMTMSFHPDGDVLAIGSGPKIGSQDDSTIRIFDLHKGLELFILGTELCDIRSLAFSPDGKLLVSGQGYMNVKFASIITLWDYTTRKQLWVREIANDHRADVIFNHAGDRIFSTGDKCRIWATNSGEELLSWVLPSVSNSMTLFPESDILCTSSPDALVRIWVTKSKGEIARDFRSALELRETFLPVVSLWFDENKNDEGRILELLESEVSNYSSEDSGILKNLVLKKFSELRQATAPRNFLKKDLELLNNAYEQFGSTRQSKK